MTELEQDLLNTLNALKRGDCWCEVAIGNPMMGGNHSLACAAAFGAVARAEAKAKEPQCKCEMTDIAHKCGFPCPGTCPAFDDDGKGVGVRCEHRRACHPQQGEAAK